jgi:S1-C subfamily serine protease
VKAVAIAGSAFMLILGTSMAAAAPTEGFASAVVVRTVGGNGAGVVIEPNRVLTAAHVVDDARRVSVEHDGRRYQGDVIAADAVSDLALIAVPGLEVPPLPLATETPNLGQDVWAVGAPGESLSVTRGVVSAVVDLGGISHIQTDAAINQGNSGGPLLGGDGTVVGIVVSKSTVLDGVGFAVTPTGIRSFLDDEASFVSDAPGSADGETAEERTLPPLGEPDQSDRWMLGGGAALMLLVVGATAMTVVRNRKSRPVEIVLGRTLPPEQEW